MRAVVQRVKSAKVEVDAKIINLRIFETGEFQAMMDVSLINDGPVTILVDNKKNF